MLGTNVGVKGLAGPFPFLPPGPSVLFPQTFFFGLLRPFFPMFGGAPPVEVGFVTPRPRVFDIDCGRRVPPRVVEPRGPLPLPLDGDLDVLPPLRLMGDGGFFVLPVPGKDGE